MLLESIIYATTPCPKIARRMGFLRENISIISRQRRCRREWANHLSNSRQTVKQAIKKALGNGSVIIFGGGLGYDLPLRELTSHFKEVVLVDLVHSLPIRLSAWKNPKIKLVTHDVTESLDNLVMGNLNIRPPHRFLDDKQVDLVISLNIMSQLPTLPAAYLGDRLNVGQEAIEKMSWKIIKNHLQYLQSFSVTVCLITDIEREIWGVGGKLIEKFSALQGIIVPWKHKTWVWDIAPLGEEDPDYSVKHRVAGIPSLADAFSKKL